MTPKQLKDSSTHELLVAYKNKARCTHSADTAYRIYRELESRLGKSKLQKVRIAKVHMEFGEGWASKEAFELFSLTICSMVFWPLGD